MNAIVNVVKGKKCEICGGALVPLRKVRENRKGQYIDWSERKSHVGCIANGGKKPDRKGKEKPMTVRETDEFYERMRISHALYVKEQDLFANYLKE